MGPEVVKSLLRENKKGVIAHPLPYVAEAAYFFFFLAAFFFAAIFLIPPLGSEKRVIGLRLAYLFFFVAFFFAAFFFAAII